MNPPVNGQDQIVKLGNFCYSSLSVATTDEVNPTIVFVFVLFLFLCATHLRFLLLKKTRLHLCQMRRF